MKNSNYHRVLRVSAVVCALALVFESGLINSSTAQISRGTHAYLANAIGMSASVQPTELNTLTAALTAKERELAAREAALREREISVDSSSGGIDNSNATYIMATILFILLVLILLNYALDYLRSREPMRIKTV
ncbi:hypothetical protein KC926_02045 [Candidatus Kaiserbacteria bacterium]|nr:hypothetical protein [Candidatus Kaiserbacteria bacterium]